MPTLSVKIRDRRDLSYPIVIEQGLFQKLPALILKNHPAHRYAIITDRAAGRLYGNLFLKFFKNKKADLLIFKGGEDHKTLATAEKLIDSMIRKGHDRHSLVITLGGGVVGDVAGFVAASFMRGIDFVQVPTTLLAMVDASIGGKTGVNSASGKNMIGAFHQPKGVYIDPALLKTLPEKEYLNGLVELIKHALIRDADLFEMIEKNISKILKKDLKFLEKIIAQSVAIKKEIVEQDERESGLRMLLNYGHTFGHAIEKASNYRISHGFAVAMGIHLVNKFCIQKGGLAKKEGARIDSLFKKLGILTVLPKKINFPDLIKIAQFDKKRKGNTMNFVALKKIGRASIQAGIVHR